MIAFTFSVAFSVVNSSASGHIKSFLDIIFLVQMWRYNSLPFLFRTQCKNFLPRLTFVNCKNKLIWSEPIWSNGDQWAVVFFVFQIWRSMQSNFITKSPDLNEQLKVLPNEYILLAYISIYHINSKFSFYSPPWYWMIRNNNSKNGWEVVQNEEFNSVLVDILQDTFAFYKYQSF